MRFRRRKLLPKTNLLDLPNCLILQLLSYLDATSLYLLSRTCERLDDLIKDHTSLWRHIDTRRAPNDRDKVAYCLARGHDDTRTFLIRADSPTEVIIPDDFFTRINALKNLTVLALENQTVDGTRYTMTSFPEGLQELSLKKSHVTETSEFFRFSGEHMKKLRVLILDGCDWVSSSAFMPISKYKNLEILSVYKCKNIENSTPYLSLSGQYGFKSLKIFDARLSPLGNTLLRSLYKSGSLVAIYLQNEDISYKLDYFRRKLRILKGAPTRDFYVEDEEFDLSDEENDSGHEDAAPLDNKGLLDYLSTTSELNKTQLPKSLLYTDPYPRCCTCGHEERCNGQKSDPSDGDDSPPKDPTVRDLEEKIARLSDMVRASNRRSRGAPLDRFQPGGGSSTAPFVIHRIIEVRLRPAREEPRKRAHEDDVDGDDKVKKQKIDEEPMAGPSNHDSEDSEEEEPPDPWPMDFDIVRFEHVDNVAKENIIPLKRLSLRGYKKITDVVLYYIKNLDLDLLDLTYTSVSVDGINNYLVDHPSCRIVHEKFCVCPTNLHF